MLAAMSLTRQCMVCSRNPDSSTISLVIELNSRCRAAACSGVDPFPVYTVDHQLISLGSCVV